jgi:hypothetical protein
VDAYSDILSSSADRASEIVGKRPSMQGQLRKAKCVYR